jgi:hypothetical protein
MSASASASASASRTTRTMRVAARNTDAAAAGAAAGAASPARVPVSVPVRAFRIGVQTSEGEDRWSCGGQVAYVRTYMAKRSAAAVAAQYMASMRSRNIRQGSSTTDAQRGRIQSRTGQGAAPSSPNSPLIELRCAARHTAQHDSEINAGRIGAPANCPASTG